MRRFSRLLPPLISGVGAVVLVLAPDGFLQAALAATTFVSNFSGTPGTPQQWHPTDWDVTIIADGPGWPNTLVSPMDASHGSDCSAPPATHQVSRVDDSVFICTNHLMTS